MKEMIECQNRDTQNEDYPQLTITDTGWTDEEREAMRERGFDDMDILRAWLLDSLEMCIIPSHVLVSSTNAPNCISLTTVPVYLSPSSGSKVRSNIICFA